MYCEPVPVAGPPERRLGRRVGLGRVPAGVRVLGDPDRAGVEEQRSHRRAHPGEHPVAGLSAPAVIAHLLVRLDVDPAQVDGTTDAVGESSWR